MNLNELCVLGGPHSYQYLFWPVGGESPPYQCSAYVQNMGWIQSFLGPCWFALCLGVVDVFVLDAEPASVVALVSSQSKVVYRCNCIPVSVLSWVLLVKRKLQGKPSILGVTSLREAQPHLISTILRAQAFAADCTCWNADSCRFVADACADDSYETGMTKHFNAAWNKQLRSFATCLQLAGQASRVEWRSFRNRSEAPELAGFTGRPKGCPEKAEARQRGFCLIPLPSVLIEKVIPCLLFGP